MRMQSKSKANEKIHSNPLQPRLSDKFTGVESQLQNALWFHEKQLFPMLSPFWAWRLPSKS